MKKFISSILVLLFSVSAFAETVSLSQAQIIAADFFGATKSASSPKLVYQGAGRTFYVFNNISGKGFVIVSGNDAAGSILAYSQENSFFEGKLPPVMDGCMASLAKMVRNTADTKSTQGMAPGIPIVDLHTAQWNQMSPYNIQCPEYNGKPTLTGCGATAIAELMQYYGYPSQGVGSTAAYVTDTYSLNVPSRPLGPYDWSLIPSGPDTDSWTSEQKMAVATLIADCGAMILSDYGPDGTSSYTTDAFKSLQNCMKYSRAARGCYKDDYTTAQWLSLLKSELDKKHPILYFGADVLGEGHIFLVEGYDSNDFLKFNWGWGGYGNGFFNVEAIDFIYNVFAGLGLVPDANWGDDPLPVLTMTTYSYYPDDNGLESSVPYITKGSDFDVNFIIANMGDADFSGEIELCRVTDRDEVVETLYSYTLSLSHGYLTRAKGITCSITSDIPDNSTDRIKLRYKVGNQWFFADGGKLSYIPLRYSLRAVTGMYYDRVNRILTLTAFKGMTCKFNGETKTFPGRYLSLEIPSQGGTYTLEISNGSGSDVPLTLTFPAGGN